MSHRLGKRVGLGESLHEASRVVEGLSSTTTRLPTCRHTCRKGLVEAFPRLVINRMCCIVYLTHIFFHYSLQSAGFDDMGDMKMKEIPSLSHRVFRSSEGDTFVFSP